MNEEKFIQNKAGKKNPFLVPEGYMDNFTTQMMQQLVQMEPTRRRTTTLKPIFWKYAAAVAILLTCAFTTYLYTHHTASTIAVIDVEALDDYQYMNDALDYAMVNNNEIAIYLTEAE